MSNEVKVALLAIATLLLSYWGYRFIQGKNILSQSNVYYVEFEDVQGLAPSSPVTISGVPHGIVAEITNRPDNLLKVLVKLDLDREIRIPKDATARIASDGLMGGRYISLVFDTPCTGEDCAQSGDFIKGESFGLIRSSVDPEELDEAVSEVMQVLRSLVNEIRTDLLEDRDSSTLARTLANLEETTGRFASISYRVDRIFDQQSERIDSTMQGLSALGQTLQDNSGNFDTLFANLSRLSQRLGDHDFNATLDSVDLAIAQLTTTLRSADGAVENLSAILAGIRDGEGSLGKLISDDELYYQISDLGLQIDSFLHNVEEKPYRYVPFKSRRKVKKYDRKDEKQEGNN